jgi:hypothetical protein
MGDRSAAGRPVREGGARGSHSPVALAEPLCFTVTDTTGFTISFAFIFFLTHFNSIFALTYSLSVTCTTEFIFTVAFDFPLATTHCNLIFSFTFAFSVDFGKLCTLTII